MQQPPFARMPHPINVASVWSDAVQPGEGRVEPFAAILLPARPKPRDEAVPPATQTAKREAWRAELREYDADPDGWNRRYYRQMLVNAALRRFEDRHESSDENE